MVDVKGERIYVKVSASQARKRLQGVGLGVRKVQSAGKDRAVIIHTATGEHRCELRQRFHDVLEEEEDEE